MVQEMQRLSAGDDDDLVRIAPIGRRLVVQRDFMARIMNGKQEDLSINDVD